MKKYKVVKKHVLLRIVIIPLLFAKLVSVNAQSNELANVLDYGYESSDATGCIQRAINSKAKRVLIPYVGHPYIVKPLFATSSDQEILFEPGVVLQAMKGKFHQQHIALFTIEGVKNVTMIGYGATLRMHKEDYEDTNLYTHSEWRHALEIRALVGKPTENITIKGFHFTKSGGDGIYVGGAVDSISKLPIQPVNILIEDVVAYDNYRQGFSITGAERLEIVNGVFMGTKGTPPEAGIDWEPEMEKMSDLKMQNCLLFNNVIGLDVFLWRPPEETSEIQLTFNNVHVDSDPNFQKAALSLGYITDSNGYTGKIIFNDCTFRNSDKYAASISNKSALRAKLIFNRCLFEQQNPNGKVISLSAYGKELKGNMTFGGIQFNNCKVNDHYNRPFIIFSNTIESGNGIRNIEGTITVNNSFGAKMSLGDSVQNIRLKVLPVVFSAPEVKILSPFLMQSFKQNRSFTFSAFARDPKFGKNNGEGIKQVNFTIRRGDKIVASSADTAMPYTFTGKMQGWAPGIYLLKAEAVSENLISNVKVVAFEIKPDSTISLATRKKLNEFIKSK